MNARQATFGTWTLTFLVVANMIGAGVFTTSGFTLEALGSPHYVVMAWVLGGLVALAGAISYGRLSRAMPESGGEYLFLSRAAHPLLGFVAGWVSLIAGFTGAIAFAATAFETYVRPPSLRPGVLPPDALAVGLVIVASLLHGVRIRAGALWQNLSVLLKLVLLTVFLVIALFSMARGGWHVAPPLSLPSEGIWPIAGALAASLVWISLSYSGFNAAVYLADEVRMPRESIPRALMRGTLLVTVLYVLLNAVFVYAPDPDRIAGRADVAAVAARAVGGESLGAFVRLIIALSLFTSVTSMMMAAPRVYAKMADDGLFPKFLRRGREAPRHAIALQAALAIAIILVSDLQELLSYLGLTLSLSAMCSVACLLLPKVRRHRWWHRDTLAPAFYIGATLVSAVILSLRRPEECLGTLLTFLLGSAAYGGIRLWNRRC